MQLTAGDRSNRIKAQRKASLPVLQSSGADVVTRELPPLRPASRKGYWDPPRRLITRWGGAVGFAEEGPPGWRMLT